MTRLKISGFSSGNLICLFVASYREIRVELDMRRGAYLEGALESCVEHRRHCTHDSTVNFELSILADDGEIRIFAGVQKIDP